MSESSEHFAPPPPPASPPPDIVDNGDQDNIVESKSSRSDSEENVVVVVVDSSDADIDGGSVDNKRKGKSNKDKDNKDDGLWRPSSFKAQLYQLAKVDTIDGIPGMQRVRKEDESYLWTNPRWERKDWKYLLDNPLKIVEINNAQEFLKRELEPMTVRRILMGDLRYTSAFPSRDVMLFLSNSLEDSKLERDMLWLDAVPYLRRYCSSLGLSFNLFDLRWGAQNELSADHQYTKLCLQELERCVEESLGPAFAAFIGDRYGYYPLPLEVPKSEFDIIMHGAEERGKDTLVPKKWYKLDENNETPSYVLQPITSMIPGWPSTHQARSDWWWRCYNPIRECFRCASHLLPEASRAKYLMSAMDREIKTGLSRRNLEKQFIFERNFENIPGQHGMLEQYFDLRPDGFCDEDSLMSLQKTKDAAKNVVGERSHFSYHIDFASAVSASKEYDDEEVIVTKAHADYLRKFSEDFVGSVARSIAEAVNRHHVTQDPLAFEIVTHLTHFWRYSGSFAGRDKLYQKVVGHMQSQDNNSYILALLGPSGCGKSAVLGRALGDVQGRVEQDKCAVVCRSVALTPMSSSVSCLLKTVNAQLLQIANGKILDDTDDYLQISKLFGTRVRNAARLLSQPTYKLNRRNSVVRRRSSTISIESRGSVVQPLLLLILDSLEKIPNDDVGKDLSWIPGHKPWSNVRMILTGDNSEEIKGKLKALESSPNADQVEIVEIEPLSREEAQKILGTWLEKDRRKLTNSQHDDVLKTIGSTNVPLHLSLVYSCARLLKSYSSTEELHVSPNISAAINLYFRRLEHKHGQLLIARVLGLITVAREGLTSGELLDILSCDDQVLEKVFQTYAPSIRRFPPLILSDLRNDLDILITEGCATNGQSIFQWSNAQIQFVARDLYAINKRHLAL